MAVMLVVTTRLKVYPPVRHTWCVCPPNSFGNVMESRFSLGVNCQDTDFPSRRSAWICAPDRELVLGRQRPGITAACVSSGGNNS